LFCLKVGNVIVVPVITRCECLEEVVCLRVSTGTLEDERPAGLLITKSGVGPEVPFLKPSGTVSGFRKAGDRRSMSISG
jgi:hypothetical protein